MRTLLLTSLSFVVLAGLWSALPARAHGPVLLDLRYDREAYVPTAVEVPRSAPPDTFSFGATLWDAFDGRWEAIPWGLWTFESGVGSHFNHLDPSVDDYKDPSLHAIMEGWVGEDLTSSAVPYFRRLTTADFPAGEECVGAPAGLGGSASLWAGVLASEAPGLCMGGGQGYGNAWNVCMEQTFNYSGSGVVSWEFSYVTETEPGCDFAYAVVDTSGSGDEVTVFSSTGSESGTASITLVPGLHLPTTAGSVILKFCVVTDTDRSDADGLFPTRCGAFAVDDVNISGGGISHTADFEVSADGWTLINPPGPGGDWSRLADVTDLPAPLFPGACPADSVLVFEDLSFGGHNSGQHNLAWSPWIDLADAGLVPFTESWVEFDVYADLPAINFVALEVWVEWLDGTCVRRAQHPYDFYSDAPLCDRAVVDLSGIVPGRTDEVRVGIGVKNWCSKFPAQCTSVTNVSPWIDNVEFCVSGTYPAPALVGEPSGLPQDAFPQDGSLDPASPGRVDNGVLLHGCGINPPPPMAGGDTLVVSGGRGGSEVYVQFAVEPGPGIDAGAFSTWLTSHAYEGTWMGLDWYSARMDTAEIGGNQDANVLKFMTAYHEDDPNFSGKDTDPDLEDPDPNGSHSRLANEIFEDDLFTPGTRISLFYKTRFDGSDEAFTGIWSYEPDQPAGEFYEWECLPSSMTGPGSFNCVLYVDHFDGGGAQPVIEGDGLSLVYPPVAGNAEMTAWDRFDVRIPTSWNVSLARPPGAQYGATVDQAAGYGAMIWNSGTAGFGSMNADDAGVIDAWLATGAGARGIHVSGDGVAGRLSAIPSASALLADKFGATLLCGSVRDGCGGPFDLSADKDLIPVGGALLSHAGRGGTHLATGNGGPEFRTFDAVSVFGGGSGAPAADEQYESLAVPPVMYASIANEPLLVPQGRTVLDGVSVHHRRHDGTYDPVAVAERLAEALDFFGYSTPLPCYPAAILPNAEFSMVRAVSVSPQALLEYDVLVRDASADPMSGVTVELDFLQSGPWTGMCSGAGLVGYTGAVSCVTDVNGFARFAIEGGGCLEPTAADYVLVRANGVPLAKVGVVSPDVVDVTGTAPADGAVTLSDAVEMVPIALMQYDPCLDFNGDGQVGILDMVRVIAPIVNGSICACAGTPCTSCP